MQVLDLSNELLLRLVCYFHVHLEAEALPASTGAAGAAVFFTDFLGAAFLATLGLAPAFLAAFLATLGLAAAAFLTLGALTLGAFLTAAFLATLGLATTLGLAATLAIVIRL